MSWKASLALALPLFVCGCLADARITRMKLELASELQAGQGDRAQQMETRILETADREFGTGSIEAVDVRTDLVRSYASWQLTEPALSLARATVDSLDPSAANQAIVRALLALSDVQAYARHWSASEATTDRLVEFCRTAPPHVPTDKDPYDECFFAQYHTADLYLSAGAYRKSVAEFLRRAERDDDPSDRRNGILELTVVGRSYARYGAYPEALFYFQRCVDETRAQYESGHAPPETRNVAATSSGDVEVLTIDSAHSFESQEPRCIEDLIDVRRHLGDEVEARKLDQWRQERWTQGPDLEAVLVERVRQSDYKWKDDYNTSYDANNLAVYYAGKGRIADAIRAYEQAVALIDRQHTRDGAYAGAYPAGLLTDELLGLASEYRKAMQPASAAAAYARAIVVTETRMHPAARWRLDALAGHASSLLACGKAMESVTAWDRYLSVVAEVRDTHHADFATGLEGKALAEEAAGRSVEARTLRSRAASIRREYSQKIAEARELPLPIALRQSAPPAN